MKNTCFSIRMEAFLSYKIMFYFKGYRLDEMSCMFCWGFFKFLSGSKSSLIFWKMDSDNIKPISVCYSGTIKSKKAVKNWEIERRYFEKLEISVKIL